MRCRRASSSPLGSATSNGRASLSNPRRRAKDRQVDFVLGEGEVAIEVKGTSRVDARALRGLRAFIDEHRPRKAILVCNERVTRLHEGIEVLPWRAVLDRLSAGDIVGD